MSIQALEEYQDYCKQRRASHLVILKDLDTGYVRVSFLARQFERLRPSPIYVPEQI